MEFDYSYLEDRISFKSDNAKSLRTIYFPLSGIDEKGIKSSITPYLSGDIKIDKNCYLTKPVSTEDLRCSLRNFFLYLEDKQVLSIANEEDSECESTFLEAGQLWQGLTKQCKKGIELKALNFVPVTGQNVELMKITVRNTSKDNIKFVPTAAVPIFARCLSNKHDHEHVSSLLNRIKQTPEGVVVKPSMVFNEEGHRENNTIYYVVGVDDTSKLPEGTFPTVNSFLADNTTFLNPEAVVKNITPEVLTNVQLQGKEAVGALRFNLIELKPEESKEYFILMGVAQNEKEIKEVFNSFNSKEKFDKALSENKKHWKDITGAITFSTKDEDFNSWMRWVTLQPILRRIFGCSFLPDHDYGKGGKGWRDIWQDLLSLILIEPDQVRDTLVNNFAGVRIDGSNATIIGSKPGEFIADRNAISRVWMDHGVWPFTALLLYINQTGDFDILFENQAYFKDLQLSRCSGKDISWNLAQGNQLKNEKDNVYKGSLIEHVLVQHLVQFFNVGEHNITKLENADWNDGLDMAAKRGESVAFMSFYGGNMLALADLLEKIAKEKNISEIPVLEELSTLLDSVSKDSVDYSSVKQKQDFLYEKYFKSVQPKVNGKQVMLKIQDIVIDLRKKGQWIFDYIRNNEKIKSGGNLWFNGYYDNEGKKVEGDIKGKTRMTLTGQVFPVMSGLATEDEIKSIVESVEEHLIDKDLGGVRLNTDFGIDNYLSLGRAFGFAYGTKENGAFFSHMTVMYAYALYSRGFAREGYKILQSIYKMAADTKKSKIYPGIPEYFDSEGKAMYHYLTGSASWLVLTELTQSFGIRADAGDLVFDPKLVKEEFNSDGTASATCNMFGKALTVVYENKDLLDYGFYEVKDIVLNDTKFDVNVNSDNLNKVIKEKIIKLSSPLKFRIILGKK
ncbi:MAG: cellobiose phosphorylase [Candidatus Zapsychrus exili]|nr:cellobiose phosphorylase [Candidatus Zapsychrus exili]